MQWLGNIPLDICNPSYQHHLTELLVRAEVVVVQVLGLSPIPRIPSDAQTHRITVRSSSLGLQYFLSRLGRKLWLSGQISLDVCIVLAFSTLADIASTLVKTFLVINNHHTILYLLYSNGLNLNELLN